MSGGLSFAGSPQAAGANFNSTGLAILKDSHGLHIGFPLSFGMTHRVAHIVTTHRFFLAELTFGHGYFSFF
jgi:hypothetical protein